jgi:hypothetical protein
MHVLDNRSGQAFYLPIDSVHVREHRYGSAPWGMMNKLVEVPA